MFSHGLLKNKPKILIRQKLIKETLIKIEIYVHQ